MRMKIVVVGTGYVGLVTGTCLAEMGNDVTCHDINAAKIAGLQRNQIPIYEPGLDELVARNQRDGRLHFTTDLREALQDAQICFVAVGTPPQEDGSSDLQQVLTVVGAVAECMQSSLTLVVKSTVPVGTCDKVRALVERTLRQRAGGLTVSVVSNPEFLKEGAAIEDFMRPDRIVVGVDNPEARDTMRQLYAPFVRNGHPVLVMDVHSSEMTKYAANVMLATRISLMNELALICNRVGADVMAVREGIGTDKRIGMSFLYPGIGFGGSCFPKDVRALSRMALDADCPADILEAVERVNRYQKVWLANRIIAHFGDDVRGRRFAIWGLAFKPKTDDIREAPALAIIKRLTDAGAHVSVYDPEAMENARALLHSQSSVHFASSAYDAAKDADAIALATEWPEFRNPDFARLKALLRAPLIFDGRNQYNPADLQRLGFTYFCIGRPNGAGLTTT